MSGILMSYVATSSSTPILDPYFSNVSLLLHMDGANSSTSFIDNSITSLTVTPKGNAQISTTQSKFGNSSAYFDGTGDYLTVSTSNNFAFTGDFTIEAWVYPTGTQVANATIVNINASTNPYIQIGYYSTGATFGVVIGASWIINNGTIPITNAWNHIAVTRQGSSVKYWLNGLANATGTNSTSLANITGLTYIGAQNAGSVFTGYIDELRITKDLVRYTTNFSPPQLPFPNS